MIRRTGGRAATGRARLGRFVLAAGLLLVAAQVRPASAEVGPGDLGVEARWNAFAGTSSVDQTRLALDVTARRAFTFAAQVSDPKRVLIRAWNLDTLKPLSGVLTQMRSDTLGMATPLAVDSSRGTVVLTAGNPFTERPKLSLLALVAGRLRVLGTPDTRFPPGYTVAGIAIDQARGRVLAIAAPGDGPAAKVAGAATRAIQLDEWRLQDLAVGAIRSSWSNPLLVPQACGRLISSRLAAALLPSRDGKSVAFGCMGNGGAAAIFGPTTGDLAGVAQWDLRAASQGEPGGGLVLRPSAGYYSDGDSIAIPGQQRLLLTTPDGQGQDTIRVFDALHGYYVGNVGIEGGRPTATSVNPVTGRAYYVNQEGLVSFEAGATPATQGTMYRELAPLLGSHNWRAIEVDPMTSRIFIPTASDMNTGKPARVTVLRDKGAATAEQPEGAGVSLDIPERPGVTDSLRTTVARAVGAEYRLVGGAANATCNPAMAIEPKLCATATRTGSNFQQFGVLSGLRLSNDQATAQAATARQDQATEQNMTTPAKNDASPAIPVQCADLGAGAATKSADGVSVSCDVERQILSGSAEYSAPHALVSSPGLGQPGLLPAAVSIRSAAASALIRRKSPLGPMSSVLTAEANGMDVLGIVRIARVSAKATTEVQGRSGTARTTYTRTLEGLTINGRDICGQVCPTAEAQRQINAALGGRGRIDFPEADRVAAKNGTMASLADNRYRHTERSLFDDVPDDDLATPAVEFTFFGDARSPSRSILSLAAVSTQQTYRIYRLGGEGAPNSPPRDGFLTNNPELGGGLLPGGVTGPGPGGGSFGSDTSSAQIAASNSPAFGIFGVGLHFGIRPWSHLAGVACLWMLLSLPAYLAARRRLLLNLSQLRPMKELSA